MAHRALKYPCSGVMLLLGLLLAGSASAQFMYVCTVQGHTFTAQEPPEECRSAEIRVLNADGSIHHRIPAPLSLSQKQAQENAAREQAQLEEARRAQARQDRALMETYSSPKEIEEARQRALNNAQLLADRAKARLTQLQKDRHHLDDEAEFYAHRELPAKLKDALAANLMLQEQQEKSRNDALAQIARINQRYDAERNRLTELESQNDRSAPVTRQAEQR
jgi:hypothetical protein